MHYLFNLPKGISWSTVSNAFLHAYIFTIIRMGIRLTPQDERSQKSVIDYRILTENWLPDICIYLNIMLDHCNDYSAIAN
jgi:hypothetical protein